MVIWLPIVLVLILLPLLVAVIRSLILKLKYQRRHEANPSLQKVDAIEQSAKNLAKAISFPTISRSNWAKTDFTPFHQFRAFLRETYPITFSTLQVLDGGELNILLYWEGEDKELLPALLMAHQDVVAADDEKEWCYPPFGETIEEGYVWGRGAFDIKGQLIAILESVERLLKEGVRPQRSWYIAFGCDEEVRGDHGAVVMANYFKAKNITFAFVIDEGGAVAENFISFIKAPVAVVGTAEKGNINISMRVTKEGGHSSSPINPTAMGLLGRAIWRVEKRTFKATLTRPVKEMLTIIGLNGSFLLSIPLLNLWLFKPLVAFFFSRNQVTNALLRNTCAVTMAEGSSAPNVIPPYAEATVNIRLLPTQSTEDGLAMLKKRVRLKEVEYTLFGGAPQSKISRTDSPEFAFIKGQIEDNFPGALVSPYLMGGGTDALRFEPLSDNVFRFSPFQIESQELKRIHGRDERLSVENLERAIRFYSSLITQSGH